LEKEATRLNLEIPREIVSSRNCGVVYCYLIETEPLPLEKLVTRFDLLFSPLIYREIGRIQAKKVIELILQYDLAYNAEIMNKLQAEDLAGRFLACFEDEEAQYYTNGVWYEEPSGRSWTPATTATFDAGIVVVGRSLSGCLWVEDED
jgi:hypothetical protein